jgi:small neutral amino acid transporter SnatA (MarC family)
MQVEEEETHSGFLIRNLLKGLAFFFVIVIAFYFLEGYIQDNFQSHIGDIRANPGILYGIYTLSEIVFGHYTP